jgi:GT2 family glycosyltransferase
LKAIHDIFSIVNDGKCRISKQKRRTMTPNKTEMENTGVSVVLGSYNRKSFLKLTIESIRQELEHAPFPHEIIVVDGGSSDGTLPWLSRQKDIVTIIQHNRGTWKGEEIVRRSWGYFMNLGFRCAQGKYICMLSDDCLIIPGAIIHGYALFNKRLEDGQKIGAMAFYWRNWPDNMRYMVSTFLNEKILINHGLFLKEALENVGYLDEQNYFFYNADSDLCLKIWQNGYSIIDSPDSYIEHYAHANESVRKSNNIQDQQDWDYFLNKWVIFENDDERKNKKIWYWIEKDFIDPDNTVNNFTYLHRMNLKFHFLKIGRALKRRLDQFLKNMPHKEN